MASTLGKKFARKEVEVIKVCGHETVLTKFTNKFDWLGSIRYQQGDIVAKKS